MSAAVQRPPGAPYVIEPGEEIEVRVEVRVEEGEEHDDGLPHPVGGTLIVGEVEYRGDRIGSSIDPADLGGGSLEYEIDQMVAQLARYVWHELGGVPVFREEDSAFTGRVEVQAPWRVEARTPTLGLIANPEVIAPAPEPEPEPEPADTLAEPVDESAGSSRSPESPVPVSPGSASVSMTTEEMAQLARGQMPESFLGRVVAAMDSEELLDQIESYVDGADADVEAVAERDQALRALRQLRTRL